MEQASSQLWAQGRPASPDTSPRLRRKIQSVLCADAEGLIPSIHVANILVDTTTVWRVRIAQNVGTHGFGAALVASNQGETQEEALIPRQPIFNWRRPALERGVVSLKCEFEAIDVDTGKSFTGRKQLHQLIGHSGEAVVVGWRPPLPDMSRMVEPPTDVVEAMGELMADDGAEAAKRKRGVLAGVECRGLEQRGGEHHLS